MAGKGSRPRPSKVSQEVVKSNWELIFGKKTLEEQKKIAAPTEGTTNGDKGQQSKE
jgi:hypothetical protein